MAFSAKAVANYFLCLARNENDHSLSPMKLQKLVYFAHGWHLGLSGSPLINEQVQAWPYGPVIPALYHEFKHYGNGEILEFATELNWGSGGAKQEFDLIAPVIPNDDSEATRYSRGLMDRVWEVYKSYSPTQLSNITHEAGTPWDTVNKQHGGKIPKDTAIPEAMMRDYFAHVKASA